jgi:hypothetical protein
MSLLVPLLEFNLGRSDARIEFPIAQSATELRFTHRLERGEACQRGQVAELWTKGEVERMERLEAGQRGKVAAELGTPGEVEQLEGDEACQFGRKSI